MTGNSKWIAMFFIAGSLIGNGSVWAETAKAPSVPSRPESGTLAVIAGKTITLDNFKAELARRQGEYDGAKAGQLLDSIIRSELLFAAAKNSGYENDPEVIQAVKQAMVGKYLRDNLEPKLIQVKATDQEAEDYYQTHLREFGTPAMVQVALIKIAVPLKASDEKKAELRKRAESARADALKLGTGTPGFGAVAINYSEDVASRYRGGDMGWQEAGASDGGWDRSVAEAIAALKAIGQVSPVIAARDGYYLVKLIDTKVPEIKPFAAVRDGVRYQVVQEKRKQLEEELLAQLKGKIPVTVNRDMLKALVPAGDVPKAQPPMLPGT